MDCPVPRRTEGIEMTTVKCMKMKENTRPHQLVVRESTVIYQVVIGQSLPK